MLIKIGQETYDFHSVQKLSRGMYAVNADCLAALIVCVTLAQLVQLSFETRFSQRFCV